MPIFTRSKAKKIAKLTLKAALPVSEGIAAAAETTVPGLGLGLNFLKVAIGYSDSQNRKIYEKAYVNLDRISQNLSLIARVMRHDGFCIRSDMLREAVADIQIAVETYKKGWTGTLQNLFNADTVRNEITSLINDVAFAYTVVLGDVTMYLLWSSHAGTSDKTTQQLLEHLVEITPCAAA